MRDPSRRQIPRRNRRGASSRAAWRRSLLAAAVIAVLAAVFGLAFAGSPAKLAAGATIAGQDVGGLTPAEARHRLEARSRALARVPVTFTANGHAWRIEPAQLGVRVDWAAAVAAVRREGEGLGPVRGFRRFSIRFFGGEVVPPTEVWNDALDLKLDAIARAVDRPHREASLKLRGVQPVVVPGQGGGVLDRKAAAAVLVRGLASLRRATYGLPVRVDPQTVTPDDLAPAAALVRTALSAPVRLQLGETHWRIPRWRLAQLLELPSKGSKTLKIGGPRADAYFAKLAKRVDRRPRNADFAVYTHGVEVVPDRPGVSLDVPATAKALLTAALQPSNRLARAVVETAQAQRTTEEAKRMGITGLAASYETIYGGDSNRIHNVQLVSHLVDRHLIAPGTEFSFNTTTGERTAAKGFLEAPVIINGELKTGLGGGICQVSTTVFNAAYEAGLKITARTNHALYISHYPLGRDATVNYPDTDLRFVNDTGHWLLLRTFVGSSSLVVALYGTPVHRMVKSEVAPLVETGPAPVKKTDDANLTVGETVVDSYGEPARATHVRRLVYDSHGKLIYDNVWYSSYRGEPKEVRVGTKPKPAATTATTATTSTTTTAKAPTTAAPTVPTFTTPTTPSPKPLP